MIEHPTPTHSSPFTVSKVLTWLAIGGLASTAAIIAAPTLLPEIGIGTSEMATESSFVFHVDAEEGGIGLAGALNHTLSYVPYVGETLAGGGLKAAMVGIGVGIGGALAGDHLDRKYGDGKSLSWGKALKYASLASSALIALPTLLSGLSVGLVYLSMLNGPDFANKVVDAVTVTTGVASEHNLASTGLSGLGAAVPHLVTCGSMMLPAAFMFHNGGHPTHDEEADSHAQKINAERHSYQPVNKQLLPDDPNHILTPEQQIMVEAYNNAPAIRKPILQRWFKEHGFTPDFHPDGTMHLYAHTTQQLGR